MPKIFLSYSHVDLGMAKQIYNDLKRYNLDVWFDKKSLLPGQKWEKEIRKSIQKSDFFIALLSSNSVSKKGFVHSELRLSFQILDEYYPASKIFIIPVRLDECDPSDADERLGKLNWTDVFPESQYQVGLKKILAVVSSGATMLRSQLGELDEGDAIVMIRRFDFYDMLMNPEGKGVSHQYTEREINGDKIIIDEATGLMWQQGGSSKDMTFEKAKKWADELDYAGFQDWWLPTLEEAMSLMEPEKKNGDLYVDPVFDKKQSFIWTADMDKGKPRAWVVVFDDGLCGNLALYFGSYVRAVRSGQSSVK